MTIKVQLNPDLQYVPKQSLKGRVQHFLLILEMEEDLLPMTFHIPQGSWGKKSKLDLW